MFLIFLKFWTLQWKDSSIGISSSENLFLSTGAASAWSWLGLKWVKGRMLHRFTRNESHWCEMWDLWWIIWVMRGGFQMSSSYMDLFLLFILLIKSRAIHINVQTKPPVELLRSWRPVHININKILPECSKSTLYPSRTDVGLGTKGSAGFVSWNLNETLAFKIFAFTVFTQNFCFCHSCPLKLPKLFHSFSSSSLLEFRNLEYLKTDARGGQVKP